MGKKKYVIQTKRMVIQPMTDEEIEKMIASSASEELRKAYGQMLSGCKKDAGNRIWYAPWKMTLKKSGTYIGDIDFKGPVKESAVEIGYGILPEYEGNGYTTEAVQAMTQWAFGQDGVIFVEAETEPENRASQRVLEKCGFIPDGAGEEGPRFVLESPPANWKAIYMLFGISIGTALGSSFGNIGIGLSLGICLGLCIGTALDASAKKERDQIRLRRHSSGR